MEYETLARAATERGDLVLRRRREEGARPVLELRAGGVFVMDTAETSTEVALATAALGRVGHPRSVLLGGLGLGFTLEAVLADPRVEQVTVVEIEEALIGWMRDGTVPHGPALLADERVRIVTADLAVAGTETEQRYDLVLLDVDNGPGHLVHEANARLYRSWFLHRLRRMLGPQGVLVVWSMDEAPALQARLRQTFGSVEKFTLPVRLQGRQEHYWLLLASGD